MAFTVEKIRDGLYKHTDTSSGSNSGQSVYYTSTPKTLKELRTSGTRARVSGFDGSGLSEPSSGSGGSGSSRVSSSSSLSGFDDYFSKLQQIAMSNNMWSAAQADKQMDFQRRSAQEAMKFNHDEAELSRVWQERMSNTAHQREVKDLQAAGLNPVLSAMGGSGAPVTSGATASGYTSQGAKGDTDTSLGPALVSLLGHIMSSQAQLFATVTSASTAEKVAQIGFNSDMLKALTSQASAREVANIQGQTSRDVARTQATTSITVAGINGQTSRVVAQIGAGATVSSAQIHAAGQAAAAQISGQYGLSVAQTNQLSNIISTGMRTASEEGIASANRQLQLLLQERGYQFDLDLQSDKYGKDWKLHLQDNATDIGQSLITAAGNYLNWHR